MNIVRKSKRFKNQSPRAIKYKLDIKNSQDQFNSISITGEEKISDLDDIAIEKLKTEGKIVEKNI